MKPTLLVLAAGMGSRYGGLKQLDPMGPAGQTILDYSVLDAARAGFGKVVFVVRREFADDFEERLGKRFAEMIDVAYAYQDLNDLPAGFVAPSDRTKPWGTAHAIRAAREVIDAPFAAINADDFYGREAYMQMAEFLNGLPSGKLGFGMVGYRLENTLSAYGSVNRGVCTVENGLLKGVEELTGIARDVEGTLHGDAPDGESRAVSPESIVSMNFWGFSQDFFRPLESAFVDFLKERVNIPKSECYLPSVVDTLIAQGAAECPVLPTQSPWFGVTYPEDKPAVVAKLAALTQSGVYPERF